MDTRPPPDEYPNTLLDVNRRLFKTYRPGGFRISARPWNPVEQTEPVRSWSVRDHRLTEIPMAGFGEALDVNLRRHFGSGSSAVSGASAREGKLGYGATKNVVGFHGPIFPVHPNREGADAGDGGGA